MPALRITPSAQGSDALPQFQVRGLQAGVISYFADVPLRNTRAIAANLYDLASVQVLKGPQGTLFGENSTGGALLFSPQRPGFDFGGYLEMRLGSFNEQQVTFAVDAPTEKLQFRIAGQVIRRDGLIENELGRDMDSRNRDAVRISAVFTPADWIENYLVVDGQEFDENLIVNIPQAVGTCPAQGLACVYSAVGINLSQQLADQQARGPRRTALTAPNYQDGWLYGISNTTNIDLGGVTVKNIFGYRKDDVDFAQDTDSLLAPILDIVYTDRTKQITEELQFQGKAFDERLSWLVGGFYRDFTFFRYTNTAVFGGLPNLPFLPPRPTVSTSVNEGRSKALFAQLSYNLSEVVDGLRVTGGYRYSWDNRSQVFSQRSGPDGTCAVDPASSGFDPVNCARDLNNKFEDDNYTLSLEWQINPSTLIYGTTRKGYTAGGFNTATTAAAFTNFDPEQYTDYEIGVKSDFSVAGMPVRVNVAAFTGKYTDIQVSQVTVIDDRPQPIVRNAASATLKGGEVEWSIRPFTGFTLSGFASYTKAEYDKFIDNRTTPPVNYAGSRFADVPTNTASVTGAYTLPLPESAGSVTLSADYYYQSAFQSELFTPTEFTRVPAFGVWNAQFNWKSVANSPIDLSIFVKNLTDNEYIVDAADLRNQLLYANATYGERRTFGALARFNF